MFGLSFGEILVILVVALLVLGPSGLPKLARTLGKGLREFRQATGELRESFEGEFYKLDEEARRAPPAAEKPAAPSAPPEGTVAAAGEPAPEGTPAAAPAAGGGKPA